MPIYRINSESRSKRRRLGDGCHQSRSGPVKTSDLVKPKQGKKIKAEFRKIVADKQKEMQEENGGGNNVIIRIKKLIPFLNAQNPTWWF